MSISSKHGVLRLPLALLFALIAASPLVSHEGHRPLPTRGMELDLEHDKILLTKAARDTLDVKTVELLPQPITQTMTTYGTIAAPWNRHALITSPLAGRIVQLHVRAGEPVRAGQVVAELEAQELEQLQLDLRTAQIASELSKRVVESTERAARSGAIPGASFIEAQAKLSQDLAAIDVLLARWNALQLPAAKAQAILANPHQEHQQRLLLRSPVEGVVTHMDLVVGKIVGTTEHLMEVIDLSNVWLKIDVLEKDLARIQPGRKIELMLTAAPDEPIEGVIDQIDPYLDPRAQTGTVWATLSNPLSGVQRPKLLPGMTGRVHIHAQSPERRMVVPMASIVRSGAERFVLVEEEQTALASTYRKRVVSLGRRSGEGWELLGGDLVPGDRVLTQGSHQLGSFFTQGVLTVSRNGAQDINLEMQPATIQSIASTLAIDGVLDVPPSHRATVSTQLDGTLARILVDRGAQLKRGDVIAELMSQEFLTLQLELLSAEIAMQLQQTSVTNYRAAQAGISERQLWEGESELNRLRSQRDALRSKLRMVGLVDSQLDELAQTRQVLPLLPLRAPIDGRLVAFDQFLGSVVQADQSLFEIHDSTRAWVQGYVSEMDVPRIQQGQAVRVRFVAAPDEVTHGTIVSGPQAATDDMRTHVVWVELTQPPSIPLSHNMFASVTIETGEATTGLAVPREALVAEGTRSYVFVQKEDQAFERRAVVTGVSNDRWVQVLDGLNAGQAVAVRGARALQSGYAALK
jgi:membrane fusion protein, heavy metal efflux system